MIQIGGRQFFMYLKNATAIGEKYPKLISSVVDCHWCETVWAKLFRGETENLGNDACKECGRCVACCDDEEACNLQ